MNHLAEASGWIASGCVLAAFLMRRMRPLRLAAIASNIAFIAYAAQLALLPILLLHVALLPINVWRLWEQGQAERTSRALPRCGWAVTALMLAALLAPGPANGAGVPASPPARNRFLEAGGLRRTVPLPAHHRPVLPILNGQDADGRSADDVGGGFAAVRRLQGEGDLPASPLAGTVPPASAVRGGVSVRGLCIARQASRLERDVPERVLLPPSPAAAAAAHRTLLLIGEADESDNVAASVDIARLDQDGRLVCRNGDDAAGDGPDDPACRQPVRSLLPRSDSGGRFAGPISLSLNCDADAAGDKSSAESTVPRLTGAMHVGTSVLHPERCTTGMSCAGASDEFLAS